MVSFWILSLYVRRRRTDQYGRYKNFDRSFSSTSSLGTDRSDGEKSAAPPTSGKTMQDPILIASELLISGRKALVMSEQKHAPEMNQRPNCLGYQLVLSEARLVRRKKRTSMTCLMVRKNERPITLTQGRTRQPLFVPLRIARCCGSAPNSRRRRSWVIRETCWDEGMAGD